MNSIIPLFHSKIVLVQDISQPKRSHSLLTMDMATDETLWPLWHSFYSLEVWSEYCEERLDMTVGLFELNRLTEVARLKEGVLNVKNEMKDMKAVWGDPA